MAASMFLKRHLNLILTGVNTGLTGVCAWVRVTGPPAGKEQKTAEDSKVKKANPELEIKLAEVETKKFNAKYKCLKLEADMANSKNLKNGNATSPAEDKP